MLELISELSDDDAVLCQKISPDIIALSTIESVSAWDQKRREVFDALTEEDQNREAFLWL